MARMQGFPEFPFPFEETASSWDVTSDVSAPLTRKERLICHVMQSVMRKPGWMKKYPLVVDKWREELKQLSIPRDLDPYPPAGDEPLISDSDELDSEAGDGEVASLGSGPEDRVNRDADTEELVGESKDTKDVSEDGSKNQVAEHAGSLQDSHQGEDLSQRTEEGVEDAAGEKAPGGEATGEEPEADKTLSETCHLIPDDVIDYALAELKWLVDSHDGGPVEPSPVAGVFIIPDADKLLERSGSKDVLLSSVSRMEDVPEEQVDYHPGSNKQVVDLVHPSLFCLAYGKTRVITRLEDDAILPWEKLINSVGDQVAQLPADLVADRRTEFISTKFQWLPAELHIPAEQGEAARFKSYINNLNPREYPELYPALASIFDTCFVPLFNRVLTQVVNPRPARLQADPYSWYVNWKGDREYDMDDDDDHNQWYEDRQPEQPKVPEFQPPADAAAEIELRGRRLQVIVKIAEIKLTPDDSVYRGGTWHVEGMKNESIVATGIYYFDSDNIKDSELHFRKAVDEPPYEQSDDKGVWLVYGLQGDSPLIQNLGSVPTNTAGLCLAFPNLYHHKVSPFSLDDKSKTGHRKILAFFLVDPGKRIMSTARVPPQQARWRRLEMERSVHPASSLPAPLTEKVIQMADAMEDEEAKDLRVQLMQERKWLLEEAKEEILERPFSLCEH